MGRLAWTRALLLLPLLAADLALAAPPTRETLRVAVNVHALRDASRADVEVSLRLWAEELMRTLEVPAEIRFYEGMADIRRDLAADRVNFVIADGLDLIRHFPDGELVDGFGGKAPSEDHMLLLTRKDAGIRHFRDLAGKRLLLMRDNAISDLWLDTACHRAFQTSCEQAGLHIGKENRSRQQIHKLFFAQADAALVRGYAYTLSQDLNPQIRTRIDILEQIPIYPGVLGLFGARVSAPFREYVIAKVPQLHDHPRGRQLLEVMQTEKVGRIPDTLLDPIRQLQRDHNALTSRPPPRRSPR